MGDVTLRRARWTPEVFAWLEEVLTEPPGVVCLDWDETCASGDIGEALVAYLDPSGKALEDYAATLAEGNTLKAYVESLYVIAGYSPAEVALHCEKAVAWALESGLVTIRPEMQNLMEVATARGWEVWVVTASGTPVVQAFAGRYGLPAARVIGMDLAMEGEFISLVWRELPPTARAKRTPLRLESASLCVWQQGTPSPIWRCCDSRTMGW